MLESPEIVRVGEKDCKVEGITQEMQSQYERFMESEYLDIIRSNKYELGEDYPALLQKHFVDKRNGVFKFASPRFYEFLNTGENFVDLMYGLLTKHQPVDRATVKEWINTDECALLFQRLMASKKN